MSILSKQRLCFTQKYSINSINICKINSEVNELKAVSQVLETTVLGT